MQVLRTPDKCFEGIKDYPFKPVYTEITSRDGTPLRIHHIDEGPRDGPILLAMHGQPVWSYLYARMIPILNDAGVRVIAPDLVGYGKSDKPAAREDYSYQNQVDWMSAWLEVNDLKELTFFGQDWGGLIGLRVVAENEHRFSRVAIANTGLPNPQTDQVPGGAFVNWKNMNQRMIDAGDIPTGNMVAGTAGDPSLKEAYDAPFPDPSYKAGPLIMPQRVPIVRSDAGAAENSAAWEVFRRWEKPFLTSFSDGDPITRGGFIPFQRQIPGAQGQPHTTIEDAGHFLQEQKGDEWAKVVVEFMRSNPI